MFGAEIKACCPARGYIGRSIPNLETQTLRFRRPARDSSLRISRSTEQTSQSGRDGSRTRRQRSTRATMVGVWASEPLPEGFSTVSHSLCSCLRFPFFPYHQHK